MSRVPKDVFARPYRALIAAIGEGAHDLYGENWGLAEEAARRLWPSYVTTTGLSWSDVRSDVRAAWERACFSRLSH